MGGINLDEELNENKPEDWISWNDVLDDEDKTSQKIEKAFKK